MRTLLILRHAKSSWKDATLADRDRPLNGRGRRDAPRVGRLLRELSLVPDLILTSPAVRARSTAELAAQAAGYEGEIEVVDDLYHAATDDLLGAAAALPDTCRRVLVVGHNPALEALVLDLTGTYERLPTGALARFDLSLGTWSDLETRPPRDIVRLVQVYRPRNPRRLSGDADS